MNKLIFFSFLLTLPLYAQDNIDDLISASPETETTAEPEFVDTPAPVTTEVGDPEVTSEAPATLDKTETPTITTEIVEDKSFNPYKSHWLVTFGFEGMKYQTYENFNGLKKNLSGREQELWGGRIGVGGEMYLGKGFMTTTKLETYFVGTLFTQIKNGGDEDEDVKFAFTKRRGHVFGGEVSQSLSYLFEMKTKNPFMDEWTRLTVEPFIEAGAGIARAYNRTSYNDELDTTDEAYRLRVSDELVNAKIGVGVNFTASSGYFLYIKATQNRYDITSRKAKEVRKDNNQPSVHTSPDFDDNIDAVTVYALGGGYKF